MPAKCTASEKKDAGLHLASALGHGMQKYTSSMKRRTPYLHAKDHKALLPNTVIAHFEKIRKSLKAKYEKVKEERKARKAAKQAGGAPKKYTSTTEVRADIAAAEKHLKTLKAVKEAAAAAKKEVVVVMQKHNSRYECLPAAEFDHIKKTAAYYERITKGADTMHAKETKKIASLKKKLKKMIEARNVAAAAKKKATKKKSPKKH